MRPLKLAKFSHYSRQEKILGKEKQKKLSKSTVAIVGLGAIGSSSAELLTRSGVNNLILIDRDYIEESNLQRNPGTRHWHLQWLNLMNC